MRPEDEKFFVLRMIEQGYSHRHIQKVSGVGLGTISRWRNEGEGENRVLVIGDIHCPCERDGYLEFCKDIQKKYNTNRTVFIGDVIDHHAISFFANDPDAPGPTDEYELALSCVKRWRDAFPVAEVCLGNHDKRPARVAKSHNIPPRIYLRDYSEVWETPGWTWKPKHKIDNVRYFHGSKCSGVHPGFNAARKRGQSTVIGHCHTRAGVKWLVNDEKAWFAMDVGCGIDDERYAFAYAEEAIEKSVIACGVVINGMPYHEIMWLEHYK